MDSVHGKREFKSFAKKTATKRNIKNLSASKYMIASKSRDMAISLFGGMRDLDDGEISVILIGMSDGIVKITVAAFQKAVTACITFFSFDC